MKIYTRNKKKKLNTQKVTLFTFCTFFFNFKNFYLFCLGLFRGCGTYLKRNGLLLLYGPFAYDGVISPESNVNFDKSLKSSNQLWGIRDVNRQLIPLASKYHLSLYARHQLPANNDLLVWKKEWNSKINRSIIVLTDFGEIRVNSNSNIGEFQTLRDVSQRNRIRLWGYTLRMKTGH